MSRWERFWVRRLPISYFSGEGGEAGEAVIHNRRATDKITKAMIKKEANNGETTKELIVRYNYENKIEHKEIRTTQWWQTKIIFIILGALVSGLIALIYFAVRISLGG